MLACVIDGQEVQASAIMDYESCPHSGKKNCPGAESSSSNGATGDETLYFCHWSHARRLCLGSACQRDSALSDFFSVPWMVIDLLTLSLTPCPESSTQPFPALHPGPSLLVISPCIIQESHSNSVQNNSFMLLHNVTWAEPIAGTGEHAGEGKPLCYLAMPQELKDRECVLGNVETWWGKVSSVK